MDTNRLKQLGGIVLTEAKKKASGSTCPFCGQKIEHGKLVEHIKSHHGDIIKYYNEQEKKK